MQARLERLLPSRGGHVQLLPNINRSGRQLAVSVDLEDLARRPELDREKPSRSLRDGELYSVVVDVSPTERAAHPSLFLEIGYAKELFTVLDKSGIPLRGAEKPPVRINIHEAQAATTKTTTTQIYLEAQTFWGSPLVDPDSLRTVTLRFVDEPGNLILDQSQASGGDIRMSDLILIGDDAPPLRMYVCDVDGNGPSLVEVAEAAKRSGVPLTVVPQLVNVGDSWLQDQFQLAYTASREGAMTTILHLPRMVNDSSIIPGTPNLKNFVDTYFPSDEIGVLKDFWQLTFNLTDGTDKAVFGVADSYVVYKQLIRVIRLLGLVRGQIMKGDKAYRPPESEDVTDLFAIRVKLDTDYARLRSYPKLNKNERDAVEAIGALIRDVSTVLGRNGDTVELRVEQRVEGRTETVTLTFTDKNRHELQDFAGWLRSIHSPWNYGGNIEVSPRTSDAPYGTIVTGSLASPELTSLLASRGSRHPLASVYTGWLDVGHVDEIMSFVPKAGGGFAIARAAPMLALELLDRARAMQGQGTLVTRLFRGKKWIHEAGAAGADALMPPRAYMSLLKNNQPYELEPLGTTKIQTDEREPWGHAAFHDDRQFLVINRRLPAKARYAAAMTCADVVRVCRATNRAVDALFLASDYRYADELAYERYYDSADYKTHALPFRLDGVLAKQFGQVPVVPLPVLFDQTDDFINGATRALTPDLVNLQTLGRHLLVPRPHGPRMRVEDAIRLIGELPRRYRPKAEPTVQYVTSHALDRTWHWTRSSEKVTHAHLDRWPTEFDADYEEMRISDWQAVNASYGIYDFDSIYRVLHAHDPKANHPEPEAESLYRIAGWFKDGFDAFKNLPVDYLAGDTAESHPKLDAYEASIEPVMEAIQRANPNVFDGDGHVTSTGWVRIEIPEQTVDIFELYTQLVLESVGVEVEWVDSWYYHTHGGGIHCGTNVLRDGSIRS